MQQRQSGYRKEKIHTFRLFDKPAKECLPYWYEDYCLAALFNRCSCLLIGELEFSGNDIAQFLQFLGTNKLNCYPQLAAGQFLASVFLNWNKNRPRYSYPGKRYRSLASSRLHLYPFVSICSLITSNGRLSLSARSNYKLSDVLNINQAGRCRLPLDFARVRCCHIPWQYSSGQTDSGIA